MRFPWLFMCICILVVLLGGRVTDAQAMPFEKLTPATMAEDFASAQFVVVGMLYNSKNEGGDSGQTTEVALLQVIKDHPSLKNKKHLTLNRHVPIERDGESYVLFGEDFKGEVDIYRGIRCSGPKSELVRYIKDIEKLAKAGRYEELDFYRRHFEHRNSDIAEDAYRSFRKATYDELEHVSKYFEPAKMKHWVADAKVPDHRKKMYKVLLSFCKESNKD
jgi:hypothetical protein